MDGITSRRISLAPAGGVEEIGQTTTEYTVVLAVLLLALGAVIFVLEPTIESFITRVGEKIAAITS
jgi:Flp pilus assembly pilin Flp